MRDLTEKQFVDAMARNGFTKDEGLLNGFRHPDLPKPMFMTVLIQANGYRGALQSALESLKQAQLQKA
jgi:hypothetical protein